MSELAAFNLEMSPQFGFRSAVRNGLSGFDLLRCGSEIAKELELFDELSIASDVEKHRSGMTSLGQKERPAAVADLFDEV